MKKRTKSHDRDPMNVKLPQIPIARHAKFVKGEEAEAEDCGFFGPATARLVQRPIGQRRTGRPG
jgi:hypothetical protein